MTSPKSQRTASLEEHGNELPSTPSVQSCRDQPEQEARHEGLPGRGTGSSDGSETAGADDTYSVLLSGRSKQTTDRSHVSSEADVNFSFQKFDVTTGPNQPALCHSNGLLPDANQYQNDIDAQIYSEASMSDASSERASPAPSALGPEDLPSGRGQSNHRQSPEQLRTSMHRPLASKFSKQGPVSMVNAPALKRSKLVQHPSRPSLTIQRPVARDDADTADLLKVVSFKFQEKEHKLNAAFSVEREKLRTELQETRNERESLLGQLQTCRLQCKDLTNAVEAHRARLERAKGLSRFLEGLGKDLQGYRKEQEKYQAAIIDFRQIDLVEFEERLADKEKREQQLVDAKAHLEKLIEAQKCEKQMVVEHRDSLKRQLEDKIGELSEERDRCLRLQQKIDTLETTNSNGVASALQQFKDALRYHYSSLAQHQDSLTIELEALRAAISDIVPTVTPDDCTAILTALSKTESSVIEQCKALAMSSKAVESDASADQKPWIVALRSLQADITGLKSTFEHRTSDTTTYPDFQAPVRQVFERNGQLEAELGAAKAAESRLTDEIGKLVAQLRDTEAAATTTPTAVPEHFTSEMEVRRLIQEAELKVRHQFSESAKVFQAEEKAKSDNEIRKLSNERDRARAELQGKTTECQAFDTELKRLKMSRTSSGSQSQRRIEDLNSAVHSLQQEVQSSLERCVTLEARLTTLTSEKQIIEETANALQTLKAELAQELHDNKESLAEAHAAHEAATSAETSRKAESDARISELQRKLQFAEDYSKKTEMGISLLKLSCQKTLDDIYEKHRKETRGLQERLAQINREVEDRVSEKETEVRRLAEEYLSHEQASWHTRISKSERDLAAEQAAREEAVKACKDLREERDALLAEAASLRHGQQAAETSQQSSPSIQDKLTPTESQTDPMPARPRKKADRNTNTIVEMQPVPAPDILRPRSRASETDHLRTGSAELDVPQSHAQVVVPEMRPSDALLMPAPPARFTQKSSDSDEMLDTVIQQQVPTNVQSVIPETQLDNTLTTFAAFRTSSSSSSARQSISLPSQAYGPSSYFAPRQSDSSEALSQRKPQESKQPPSPGFQIYEDPHSSHSQSQNRSNCLTEDDFVFRKALPKPNSASKRAARSTSANSARDLRPQRPREEYQTHEIAGGPGGAFLARAEGRTQHVSQALGSDGSTPPFMQQHTGKKAQQYHGSSSGKVKRRSSQRSTTLLPDPRLAARAAGQKRAAERINQQLEQPLQKRRMMQTTAPTRGAVNDGAIGRASQSVNDLPRISNVLTRRPSNNDQSRMLTFGGQSSRATRRSKKLLKHDEYSARFSQELDRR